MFFFLKLGINVTVVDGRLYFETIVADEVKAILQWFCVWMVPELKTTRKETVSFYTCNTNLLCEIAWLAKPFMNNYEGTLVIPDYDNYVRESMKLSFSRKFNNDYRWYVMRSLDMIADDNADRAQKIIEDNLIKTA